MRRPASLLLALLLGVLCSACGGAASAQARPRPAPTPASAPQLSPGEATAIAKQLWESTALVALISPDDPSRWAAFEEGTVLQSDQFYAGVRQGLGKPELSGSPALTSTTTWVPRTTSYPRWFLVQYDTFDTDNDGNVTTDPITDFDIVQQDGPQSRWKEEFSAAVPGHQTPAPIVLDKAGYAVTATGPLVRPLASLPGAYASYLASGGTRNAAWFAPGPVTSDEAPQAANPGSPNLAYRYAGGGYPTYQFALRGGSAFGIFGTQWIATIGGHGGCLQQNSSRTQTLVWVPPGKWAKVTATLLLARTAVIPPAGRSGAPARVSLFGPGGGTAGVLAVATDRGSC